MAGLRELLAVVLGVALGVLLVVYPHAFIRIQTLGRIPHDRHGGYGSDGSPNGWARVVQLLGVACLLAAGYVALQLL
ncbi:hypothetical protein [Salarchaeum japonicum]|uniref:Uncharacterized protein n=1 Tax=Salarchaeum japonicum TaxID=555573 RepID=A0AAV3T1B6_9EURY|nr:hypothetical protein [Salarchaeum japonicum]